MSVCECVSVSVGLCVCVLSYRVETHHTEKLVAGYRFGATCISVGADVGHCTMRLCGLLLGRGQSPRFTPQLFVTRRSKVLMSCISHSRCPLARRTLRTRFHLGLKREWQCMESSGLFFICLSRRTYINQLWRRKNNKHCFLFASIKCLLTYRCSPSHNSQDNAVELLSIPWFTVYSIIVKFTTMVIKVLGVAFILYVNILQNILCDLRRFSLVSIDFINRTYSNRLINLIANSFRSFH